MRSRSSVALVRFQGELTMPNHSPDHMRRITGAGGYPPHIPVLSAEGVFFAPLRGLDDPR